MNQKQVNSKLNEIAMQLKSIDTIGLNYMEYLAALIYAIYGIEQEPNNFLIVKELVYTVQILDEQLYKIRKNERSEKLFINIRFREVIKNENYLIFKNCVLQMEELVKNTQEYGKKLIAEAFEDAITKAAKNNEISFQNTGDQISGSRFSFDAYIACMGDFVYPIYGTLAEGFRDIAGCGGISAECVLLSDEGSI